MVQYNYTSLFFFHIWDHSHHSNLFAVNDKCCILVAVAATIIISFYFVYEKWC